MKPVADDERLVVNIFDADFEALVNDRGEHDGYALQLDRGKPLGTGFHVYKMAPGTTTVPHEHTGNEEFLVISGDLTDNDGTVYREGDLVSLKAGTQHCSRTERGCLLAVFIETAEKAI